MKIVDLFEMPIRDITHVGDFSQSGSFDSETPKDRLLVGSDKHMARLRRVMTKTSFTIDCYFVNFNHGSPTPLVPVTTKIMNQTGGQYESEDIKRLFGFEIQPKRDAISFVLASNVLGNHRLSVWMIIHRFMHLIEDGVFKTSSLDYDVLKAMDDFHRLIYGQATINAHHDGPEMRHAIDQATMGSARRGLHTDKVQEISMEMLTQYLVTGMITLKSDKTLETKLNQVAYSLFSACTGKIFAGF